MKGLKYIGCLEKRYINANNYCEYILYYYNILFAPYLFNLLLTIFLLPLA